MDVVYLKQLKKASSAAFDTQFARIMDLAWLPWVGGNYTDCRILIVAESHFTNPAEKFPVEPWKNEYSDPFYTRKVVAEYPMLGFDPDWRNNANKRNNPAFDNLFRLLVSDDLLNDPISRSRRAKLCSNFAFMNMMQRATWYSHDRPKDRPTEKEREMAWEIVVGVLGILMPDLCIVAGTDAAASFRRQMVRLHVPYENWKCGDHKIGNTIPKSATVILEGKKIPFKFIRHPGSNFRWEEWQEFVFSDCRHIRAKLLSNTK